MNEKHAFFRLETPQMAGYRMGMSSSSAIGCRLHRVYNLPSDVPAEINNLLQAIERKPPIAR